jgi:hypothetical protein
MNKKCHKRVHLESIVLDIYKENTHTHKESILLFYSLLELILIYIPQGGLWEDNNKKLVMPMEHKELILQSSHREMGDKSEGKATNEAISLKQLNGMKFANEDQKRKTCMQAYILRVLESK